jgi:hypothetical protein
MRTDHTGDCADFAARPRVTHLRPAGDASLEGGLSDTCSPVGLQQLFDAPGCWDRRAEQFQLPYCHPPPVTEQKQQSYLLAE